MRLRLSFFPSLASLLLATLIAACGGGDDDDGGSSSCDEALEHSDLAWIQDNVFTGSCALSSSCHQGGAQSANGLNLESGMSQVNLVGVPAEAEEAGGINLVEPGDPANSYLLVILGHFGEDDPRIPDTGTMPAASPLLCVEKRDAIERWIESL